MGPFAWLAGRWTPEFEYRDRLADEVEDIAYESTRIGVRRGFLMGVLVGAILVLFGIASFRASGLETTPPPTAARQESRQQAPRPQPPSQELTFLRQENEQLKGELAKARAAGTAAQREKRVEDPRPSQVKQVKKAPRAIRPSTPAPVDAAVKPEAKASPPRSDVAQPIPSNCRQEGVCDPTGP